MPPPSGKNGCGSERITRPSDRADRPARRRVARVADPEVGAQAGLEPVLAGEAVEREEVGLVELGELAVLVRHVGLAEVVRVDDLGDRLDDVLGAAGGSHQRPAQLGRHGRHAARLEAVGLNRVVPDLVEIEHRPRRPLGQHAPRQQPLPVPVDAAAGAHHVGAVVAQDAERLQVDAEAAADQRRLDQPAVVEHREGEGHGRGVLVVAQALEADGAELDVLVGAGARDADEAGQPVGVGIVVLLQEAVVARDLEVEVGDEALRQPEGAVGEDRAAARVAVEAVVEGDDAPEVEAAVGEAAAVLALEQHAAARGHERRHRGVGRGAEGAVVGQLEAEAVDVGLREARHQHAARPLDAGLGDREPRQVADRQAEDLDAGVLEVDPALDGVAGDARGADRPGRGRVAGADRAGAGDHPVERGVALAAAPDLGGGELQLAGDQQPRARDQPLGQVGGQRGGVGEQDAALGVGQHDRAFGADLVGGLVVGDARGAQHPALVEHLDVAAGDEAAGLAVVADLVGDEARRQRLRRRRRAASASASARPRVARRASHPSSRCSRSDTASRIAATGGVQAATSSGIWPRPPSDSAKSLRK